MEAGARFRRSVEVEEGAAAPERANDLVEGGAQVKVHPVVRAHAEGSREEDTVRGEDVHKEPATRANRPTDDRPRAVRCRHRTGHPKDRGPFLYLPLLKHKDGLPLKRGQLCRARLALPREDSG